METKIELKEHNKSAVNELREALKVSQRVCTMRATGTGKSYIIAELSKDYDSTLIIAPSTYIIEQQKRLIGDREGVNYVTYQKTITKDYKIPTEVDAIFLDEFHRVGAEHWGEGIDKIIEKNPKAKVIGFTATTIRGLEGRDMAQEVFGGNVVSPLSLPEAWVDGILKLPIYVSSLYEIDKIVEEEKKKAKGCKEAIEKLGKLAVDWKKSGGIPSVIMDYLPKNSKRVIIFLSNISELKKMRKTIEGWFELAGFHDAKFYEIHKKKSNPGKELTKFSKDDKGDSSLKVILSVNMLNEGLHIPEVDSVMFLRKTESNIIFLQQLGRCLTVDHKKAPIIFDFVGNIESTCINSIGEINKEMEKIQESRRVKEDNRIRLNINGTLLDTISVLKSIQSLYVTIDYRKVLQEMIKRRDYSEVKCGTNIYHIVRKHKKGGKGEYWPEADICWKNRSSLKISPYLIKMKEIIKSDDYSEIKVGTALYQLVIYHRKDGKGEYWPEADICWKNRPGALDYLSTLKEMIKTGDFSEVKKGTKIYNAIRSHKKDGKSEYWPEADICWANRPRKRGKGK